MFQCLPQSFPATSPALQARGEKKQQTTEAHTCWTCVYNTALKDEQSFWITPTLCWHCVASKDPLLISPFVVFVSAPVPRVLEFRSLNCICVLEGEWSFCHVLLLAERVCSLIFRVPAAVFLCQLKSTELLWAIEGEALFFFFLSQLSEVCGCTLCCFMCLKRSKKQKQPVAQ